MDLSLEFFTNDRYEILNILFNKQVQIKEDFYIPLSQQEIADIAHFSKLKTNKIINELIDNGLVEPFKGKKGKYALTEKANNVLNLIQKTNI